MRDRREPAAVRRAAAGRHLLLAALPALAALLAAPSQDAAAQQPRPGGTLVYAVNGAPPTSDCHASSTFATLHYVAPHYSLLVKFDPETYPRIVGDLAESWTVSADQRTYTFRLRDGVQFHDGTRATAQDVLASFERLRAPPAGILSARATYFANIDTLSTPDERTFIVTLKRPQPSFLAIVANPFNCIYSAARLTADANYPARQVMGTGPFEFVEYVAGSHWVGRRFERYFLPGRPYLDGFRAVNMAGPAIVSGLEGGQILAEFRGFSPAIRDRLVAAMGPRAAVQEGTWALSLVISMNARRPPFDDARVRRALNIAIDRWSASQSLSRIVALRAVGATQRPGSPFAATEEELQRLPGFSRDMVAARAEARRLLQEAGRANLTFRLTSRNIQDPYIATAVFLIDQWRQIGVNVENVQVEGGPWQAALSSGNFDMIFDFSNEFVDDPELELAKYISADRSSTNSAGYVDRVLDGIYDQLVAITDQPRRRQLVRDFEARLYEQSYMMPFLWQNRITVTSARVRGWHITPSHLLNQDLRDVWLAE